MDPAGRKKQNSIHVLDRRIRVTTTNVSEETATPAGVSRSTTAVGRLVQRENRVVTVRSAVHRRATFFDAGGQKSAILINFGGARSAIHAAK